METKTRDTIARLRAIKASGECYTYNDVVTNFMGGLSAPLRFLEALIDLLERSDPTEWDEELLDEYGMVRLPRDRDGEVIHVGDTVWGDNINARTVESINIRDHGKCSVSIAYENCTWVAYPNALTHRKPVTVDSLLRELTDSTFDIREEYLMSDMSESEFHERMQELRDSYATKLRLANESD